MLPFYLCCQRGDYRWENAEIAMRGLQDINLNLIDHGGNQFHNLLNFQVVVELSTLSKNSCIIQHNQ